jgi:hypothetical protein
MPFPDDKDALLSVDEPGFEVSLPEDKPRFDSEGISITSGSALDEFESPQATKANGKVAPKVNRPAILGKRIPFPPFSQIY